MGDGDALLRSILVAPGEDTARLVYADWLQESGRTRLAEFIRRWVPHPESGRISVNENGRWSFKGRGFARVGDVSHHKKGDTTIVRELMSFWEMAPDAWGGSHFTLENGMIESAHLTTSRIADNTWLSLFRKHPILHVGLMDWDTERPLPGKWLQQEFQALRAAEPTLSQAQALSKLLVKVGRQSADLDPQPALELIEMRWERHRELLRRSFDKNN